MSILKRLDPEYRLWYERGWRYSLTTTEGSLDHGINFPMAWEDGYLDLAAGRDKWHLAFCVGCSEHDERPVGRGLAERGG